jgi:hypothetical protein
MAGILANSASQTMLAGATSADHAVSGYIALEEVVLSVTPTGSSYSWAIAKPSGSSARAALSSTTDASPTFTPDVAGFYTLTCVVDSVTTYVLRVAVSAIGEVSTIDAIRLVPILNAQVPTPATGRTIFSSSELNDLAQKLPDGNTYPIAGGGGGSGSGFYATIAALKAITSTMLASLDDGVSLAYVAPLKSWFVWDAASTVADDTTDFLSIAITANGAAAGRFRRLDWSHPSWLEQTAWFVSTAGSNDADGATALTPVKTDAEIRRRWGSDVVLAVPVTITYAESPTTTTNLDVSYVDGGSLSIIGTPTVSKSGTVLTAVQAQVRTAGAELAWAITAVGLDATDIGKLAVITAGTAANIGAYAAVLKDEGGGKVRVSPFGKATAAGGFTQVTPVIGDTVEIREMATVLKVGFINIRGRSQLNAVASPVQNVVMFDSVTLDGSVGGGSQGGTIRNEHAPVVYARCVLQDLIVATVSTNFAKIHQFCGGLIVGGLGGTDFRGNAQLRQTAMLNVTVSSSSSACLLAFAADCYFQNSQFNVNPGCEVATAGIAFFDRASSDSALSLGVAVNGGPCIVRHSGATPDWGAANTGHGIRISAGASYIYATKPTINSGLGAGREVLVGGTDKLYSAVPYIEPGNNAMIALGEGTDGSAVFYSAYSNVAALKAITAARLAGLVDGQRVFVTTLKAWFAWDAIATDADDATDFLVLTVTANGASAGRFRRLTWAHPAWLLQAAWFVSTSGSNENDGATALTPVKTDVEILRRWGLGQSARIGVPVTITYAQSPAGQTNFNVEVVTGGSLTLVGTPTISKAGTIITAVQAQVRTAGAEAGWAITGSGLGATEVGKFAVITAGTAGNIGAYAYVLKDEGGGKVRVTPFGKFSAASAPFTQVTPVVGDTIEIRDVAATTLAVGLIGLTGSLSDIIAASPTRNCVVLDSLRLDGSSSTFNGCVDTNGMNVQYARTVFNAMTLMGASRSLSFHSICGGGVASGGIAVRATSATFRQTGFSGVLSASTGSGVTLNADCYFQNATLSVVRGSFSSTQGAAFFDRSVSDQAMLIASGGFVQHTGAVPDWGTANAGHGITLQSNATYSYATKPTINGGLGAGREAKVGGTDKLWSAIPYIEVTNNAALTAPDTNTDSPVAYYQAFANVAALKALTAARLANLQDGQRVYVTTLRAWFAWDATSSIADDTNEFLSVSVTANGVAAGRFRRLDWAHPTWREQTAWFVSTAGSNENDGLTVGTPVRTDFEIQRRWGVQPRFVVPVSITYAETPVAPTTLFFEIGPGGSLTLIGTPTVTKTGTVLTAVQTQVRTAGAELGWAITGTGLGASDVGKLAVITASGTPANVGAYARILKDETGGKVRVSPFGTYSSATFSGFTQVTPQVGDTIEVRDPMLFNVATIEGRSAYSDPIAASPPRQVVIFDSLALEGSSTTVNGSLVNNRVAFHYVRSILQNINLYSSPGSLTSHTLCGGGIAGASGLFIRGGCFASFRQCGVVNSFVTLSAAGSVTAFADTYFQNSTLNFLRGSNGNTQGAAFFDRSVASASLNVNATAACVQSGAVPDWGTANLGFGTVVASAASYVYATKPTINSGLGAGREARVGGTDKLYSAVPFIEPANNAALVLAA